MKEFECLNMVLDAKLVLSNKLVNELKCEREYLKMHDKCLIAELTVKKNENICCNHVVVPDVVPIVCSTSKDKLMYIPPHKRNQKVERKALKPKPLFRSQSKFVPTCHHCDVISHIRPQCPKNKTMLLNLFSKSLVNLNTLFVIIMVPLVILDHIVLSFKLLKE